MATIVTVAGTSYSVPNEGDSGYANDLTALFIKLATSTAVLQITSSTFPITQDISFGTSYGLKLQYLKSLATNPAATGQVRLGNAESLSWRNAANSADLALSVNASNALQFNGANIVSAGAASIVNADISASAAIAYSKLNLATSIVNADISLTAAIALTKLAATTVSRALVSDASGFVSASAVIATELSYVSGVTSALQTQINLKAPIASPTFTGTVAGITSAMVGLGNVDNTSDATKNAAVATLTNKTLTTPIISTISNTGTITLPTATGTLATLAGTEVLTNKDIDGGVAANTRRITVPKAAKATLDALTRKEATIVYGTDTAKAYVDNGTSLIPIGSGSAGGLNYILNPDAEADATGWATYADAAAATPVDGTGGTPASTYARSTSSPLASTASFLWDKTAVNRQGEGFSYSFTIDSAYKGQQLAINHLLEVTSGTFVTGDMTCWILDVTNNVLIQPSAYQVVNTAIAGPVQPLVFQAASNSVSYRLIFHTSTVSALAYSLKFDNFSVGPQIVPVGAAMSDWTALVPVITGLGTVTNNEAEWRRVGDEYFQRGSFTVGTSTAVTARIGILSGLAANFTSPAQTTQTRRLGTLTKAQVATLAGLASTAAGPFAISNDNTNTTSLIISYETSTSPNHHSAAVGSLLASSGQHLSYEFSVKIVGWASNVLSSDSAATRVVAAQATHSGTLTVTGAYADMILDTKTFDTHGVYSTTTGVYTVAVPGNYRVTADGQFSGVSLSVGQGVSFRLMKNGVVQYTLSNQASANATVACPFEYIVQANAGDTLKIQVLNGCTTPTLIAAKLQFEMIQGPAQIQAATVVAASYTSSTGQSIANTSETIFTPATKLWDTTGSFNTATGEFTCPGPGKYSVKTSTSFAAYLGAGSNLMGVYKNGVLVKYGPYVIPHGATATWGQSANVDLDCIAGDKIHITIFQSSGAARTLIATATFNYLDINRMSGVN